MPKSQHNYVSLIHSLLILQILSSYLFLFDNLHYSLNEDWTVSVIAIYYKKYTYIYNSEGLIIFDSIGYFSCLICITTFATKDCVKELTKVRFLLKRFEIVPIWLLVLWEVLEHMTFESYDGIWISNIHRDRIPQLFARYWDRFLSHCYSSIIYLYIRAVSSYSLWYLVLEVKVNLLIFFTAFFFTAFTPCWTTLV